MENSYTGVLADWKVKMIAKCARRLKFRRDEIEDAEQEVVMAILNFKYDPTHKTGASEAATLRMLIHRQLLFIQRGQIRANNRLQKHRSNLGVRDGKQTRLQSQPDHTQKLSLEKDVETIMAILTDREKAVCRGLKLGVGREQIAADLKITRHQVELSMNVIREKFEQAELH